MSFWSSAGLLRRQGRRTTSRVRVGASECTVQLNSHLKRKERNKRRETKACVL